MLVNFTRKIFLNHVLLNLSIINQIKLSVTSIFYYFPLVRNTIKINNYLWKPMEHFRELDFIHYISSGGPYLTDNSCGKENEGLKVMRNLRFEEYEKLPDRDGSRMSLKVMSYNVLAQSLLDEHMYLYRNCEPITLKWNFRFPRILGQVVEHNPDILCLQEVQENQINVFYDKLEDLGYVSVFKKRTGTNKSDGCAIYFRRNMFDLVEDSKVEYYRDGVPLLNRDNVAVLVKLRCKVSNRLFVVANTHLLYNPKRMDVRLAQIQLLLSEIYRLTEGDKYKPEIIITGDLNSLPDSPVVKLITEGMVTHSFKPLPNGITKLPPCPTFTEDPAKETCGQLNSRDYDSSSSNINDGYKICHDFNLQSVYPYVVENDTEATTFQNSWVTVDYIFYSSCRDLELQSKLRLPTCDECEKYIKHLPNFVNPSDHLPLVATFLFSVD